MLINVADVGLSDKKMFVFELSTVAKSDRLKMVASWKGWSGCGNVGS
jgi:hypothetical protein